MESERATRSRIEGIRNRLFNGRFFTIGLIERSAFGSQKTAPAEITKPTQQDEILEPQDPTPVPSEESHAERLGNIALMIASNSLPDACPTCHDAHLNTIRDLRYWTGRLSLDGVLDKLKVCSHTDKMQWAGVAAGFPVPEE